jgi:alternate signal-mediated exported protein
MKKIKLKSKPLLFILLLLVVGIVGTTFAYFYSEVVIPNKFQAMTYNVTLKEEFYDKWGTKKVTISNNEKTNTPVVLRISYNESWRETINDTTVVSLDNNVNGKNVVTKNWTTTFTNDFVKGDDGWYYYKKVLSAEESITILESIALNEDLIKTSAYYNDYKKATYQLDFNYEAIQADSNAIAEIWNKTVTISNKEVTWS